MKSLSGGPTGRISQALPYFWRSLERCELRFSGSEFRVWCLLSDGSGFRFGVWGLGFEGFGFRVSGFGFLVSGFGFRVSR